MKQLLFFSLLLAAACSWNPASSVSEGPAGGGCPSTVVVKSIADAPFTVTRIGETWCLNAASNDERLIPCDWTWDASFQVEGLNVLLTGDYPEWTPNPNARYIGRPFKVRGMRRAQ